METTISSEKWPFWPVLLLSLLYPINNALLSLAIPIYYFNLGTSIEIIGLLSSGSALTYCFSPILVNNFSNMIGRRNSILIACLGGFMAEFTFFFTLNPVIFFISRLTEGFVMGFFWTSLQSSISDNVYNQDKLMSRYNFSWNLGLVLGFLLGFLVLFFSNKILFVFYISALIILGMFIVGLSSFKEPLKLNGNNSQLQSNNSQLHSLMQRDSSNDPINIDKDFSQYNIPVILPTILIIIFSLLKTGVSLLYPIKSEIIGFPGYSTYLLSFLTIIVQAIFASLGSNISFKLLKKTTYSIILVTIPTIILFGITTNFFVFLILFLIVGAISGYSFGIALKMFLSMNIRWKTSKYSGIIETVNGIAFFLSPILMSLIAAISLNFSFYFMASIIGLLLIIYISFNRRIMKI